MGRPTRNKFLCDKMCAELGRWLRVAGYDTAIIDNSCSDAAILERAVREGRLLLSRDRDFTRLDPEQKASLYLKGESLDGWANQLREELSVDWLFAPFSRCLVCNAVLEEVDPPPNLPEGVRQSVDHFWSCTECHQVFWRGSHTEHMEERLRAWQPGPHRQRRGEGGDV